MLAERRVSTAGAMNGARSRKKSPGWMPTSSSGCTSSRVSKRTGPIITNARGSAQLAINVDNARASGGNNGGVGVTESSTSAIRRVSQKKSAPRCSTGMRLKPPSTGCKPGRGGSGDTSTERQLAPL